MEITVLTLESDNVSDSLSCANCEMNFFPQELNVGAKDVRIFVGGELVWEGVIDKVRTEPDGQIVKNSLWTCKGGGGVGDLHSLITIEQKLTETKQRVEQYFVIT